MILNTRGAATRAIESHTEGVAERLAERESYRARVPEQQAKIVAQRERATARSHGASQPTSRLVSCEMWPVSTYLVLKEQCPRAVHFAFAEFAGVLGFPLLLFKRLLSRKRQHFATLQGRGGIQVNLELRWATHMAVQNQSLS